MEWYIKMDGVSVWSGLVYGPREIGGLDWTKGCGLGSVVLLFGFLG